MSETATDIDGASESEPEAQAHPDEPGLEPEVAARRTAALAHVRKYGDPVLRMKARPVGEFDEALVAEVTRMAHLMEHALGSASADAARRAAPRARLSGRAPMRRCALVNPVLEWARIRRGDRRGGVPQPSPGAGGGRASAFTSASARRMSAALPILIEASGLQARVIQHESATTSTGS